MARKGNQIPVRLRRVEMANRLLEWLKDSLLLEGRHVFERVIIPFAKMGKPDEVVGREIIFEVWKAWDILRESGRRASSPGGHFTILYTDAMKADQFGNLIDPPDGLKGEDEAGEGEEEGGEEGTEGETGG